VAAYAGNQPVLDSLFPQCVLPVEHGGVPSGQLGTLLEGDDAGGWVYIQPTPEAAVLTAPGAFVPALPSGSALPTCEGPSTAWLGKLFLRTTTNQLCACGIRDATVQWTCHALTD
jgi:hypothetical protein